MRLKLVYWQAIQLNASTQIRKLKVIFNLCLLSQPATSLFVLLIIFLLLTDLLKSWAFNYEVQRHPCRHKLNAKKPKIEMEKNCSFLISYKLAQYIYIHNMCHNIHSSMFLSALCKPIWKCIFILVHRYFLQFRIQLLYAYYEDMKMHFHPYFMYFITDL